MSSVDASLIDSIITKQGVKSGSSAFDLLPAVTNSRPYVCFAKVVGAGGQITVGGRVVHDDGDTTMAGLYVGNKGEAVQVVGGIGIAYLCTFGHLKVSGGAPLSADQTA